jgi:hypothetical protein
LWHKQGYFCQGENEFKAPPPSFNLTKPSAPGIAHDVACKIIMLERVEDCHGRQQRPWQMAPMISGLVLQKQKIGVTWNMLTALFWMTIFHKMG